MGDTGDSEAELLTENVPIPAFPNVDSWLQEFKEAAIDPLRAKASDDHRWNVATELSPTDTRLLRKFEDEMYTCIGQAINYFNSSRIRICGDSKLFENTAAYRLPSPAAMPKPMTPPCDWTTLRRLLSSEPDPPELSNLPFTPTRLGGFGLFHHCNRPGGILGGVG